MSSCWWEDNQIAHSLIVSVDREVCFEHLVGVQIVPIEMRRDALSRYESIVFLL
jgi:hypothetical protein